MSGSEHGGDRGDLKSTPYEFFMLAMAILSIANLPLSFLFPFKSQSWWLIAFVDSLLTIVFVIDFGYDSRPASTQFIVGGGTSTCGLHPGLRIRLSNRAQSGS
jgi:hypothetical protein